MSKSYQIVQERYEVGNDYPTQDSYPFLFASVDECLERIKRDGYSAMFEHADSGCYYHIAELAPYRDGVSYTGMTFSASLKASA